MDVSYGCSDINKIGLGLGLACCTLGLHSAHYGLGLGLGLVGLCCVEKHDLVTLVVIMILKDTATFQVLCRPYFSILCLEHRECRDQQRRSLT